jgi:hypothetical protein
LAGFTRSWGISLRQGRQIERIAAAELSRCV